MKTQIEIHIASCWTGSRGGYGYVMSTGGRMKKFNCDCYYVDTTENRLDLRATIEALGRITARLTKVVLYSNNEYIIKGIIAYVSFNDSRRLSANPDLWKKLYSLIDQMNKDGNFIVCREIENGGSNNLYSIAKSLAAEASRMSDPESCGKRKSKYDNN